MLFSLVFSLGSVPLASQVCVPLGGTGQPGYAVAPPCMGLVAPAVLYKAGNPGFMVGAFAPLPALLGHPMLLVIGVTGPGIPIGTPPLFPPYGPGILTFAPPPVFVIPSGPAGPAPVFSVIPLPATGGPLGMVLTAHTVVLLGPSVALSKATGIVI
jgi:hypothetical protein